DRLDAAIPRVRIRGSGRLGRLAPVDQLERTRPTTASMVVEERDLTLNLLIQPKGRSLARTAHRAHHRSETEDLVIKALKPIGVTAVVVDVKEPSSLREWPHAPT